MASVDSIRGRIESMPPYQQDIAKSVLEKLLTISRATMTQLVYMVLLSICMNLLMTFPAFLTLFKGPEEARAAWSGDNGLLLLWWIALPWILFGAKRYYEVRAARKAARQLQMQLIGYPAIIGILKEVVSFDPFLRKVLCMQIVRQHAPDALAALEQ